MTPTTEVFFKPAALQSRLESKLLESCLMFIAHGNLKVIGFKGNVFFYGSSSLICRPALRVQIKAHSDQGQTFLKKLASVFCTIWLHEF